MRGKYHRCVPTPEEEALSILQENLAALMRAREIENKNQLHVKMEEWARKARLESLSKNTLVNALEKPGYPQLDTLAMMAAFFGVTVATMLTKNCPTSAKEADSLAEVVRKFCGTDDTGREALTSVAKTLQVIRPTRSDSPAADAAVAR